MRSSFELHPRWRNDDVIILLTGRVEASNSVIDLIPDSPAMSLSQQYFTPTPSGVTSPLITNDYVILPNKY